MSVGLVVSIVIYGFLIGGLARFALPGPDPMPAWLTIAIGLVGALAGGLVGHGASGGNDYAASLTSFGVAIILVGLYRRFVQKRPVFGPGALKFPERGIGVEQYRERLRKAGVDPDQLQPDPKALEEARLRGAIEELHRAGLLDDEEHGTMLDRLKHERTDTNVP